MVRSYDRIMDLQTFRTRFVALRNKGFVKTERRGNTGVGHTLEVHLGITENNIALSDLDVAELKAHRDGSSSLITLFTRDRGAWVVDQMEAIHRYGTVDESGRPNLYMTLFAGRGESTLMVEVDKVAATVRHRSGTVVARWEHGDLAESFSAKFPALMLVTAEVQNRSDGEWFRYRSARLLRGTSSDRLREGMASGHIAIDLRLHDKGGAVRNHGTGFRISEAHLDLLFEESLDI